MQRVEQFAGRLRDRLLGARRQPRVEVLQRPSVASALVEQLGEPGRLARDLARQDQRGREAPGTAPAQRSSRHSLLQRFGLGRQLVRVRELRLGGRHGVRRAARRGSKPSRSAVSQDVSSATSSACVARWRCGELGEVDAPDRRQGEDGDLSQLVGAPRLQSLRVRRRPGAAVGEPRLHERAPPSGEVVARRHRAAVRGTRGAG